MKAIYYVCVTIANIVRNTPNSIKDVEQAPHKPREYHKQNSLMKSLKTNTFQGTRETLHARDLQKSVRSYKIGAAAEKV